MMERKRVKKVELCLLTFDNESVSETSQVPKWQIFAPNWVKDLKNCFFFLRFDEIGQNVWKKKKISTSVLITRCLLSSLRSIINFTNILRSAFALISFRQKNTNPICKPIKAAHNTYVWKVARKMLVKLTPGRQIGLVASTKKKE